MKTKRYFNILLMLIITFQMACKNNVGTMIKNHRNNDVINLISDDKSLVSKTDYRGLTPLELAIIYHNNQLLDFLISEGSNVNHKIAGPIAKGYTPLILAIKSDNKEAVKILIDKDVNIYESDDFGRNALHFAAIHGLNEIVNILIDTGMKINIQDKGGLTPLHYAARNGYYNAVKTLLLNGANVNIKNNENKTPFDLAKTKTIADLIKSNDNKR